MRFLVLLFIATLLAGTAFQSAAQQSPAIPMTVKSIVKSPPKTGQLLQVTGYLVTEGKVPKLQDTDNNRKLILDFSQSSVALASLSTNAATPSPVLIIGRMQGTKDNGKPIIGVIGATTLTP